MSDEQIRNEYLPRPPEDDYAPVRRFTYNDVRKDQQYLRILSIFYYIVAVFIGVLGLLPGFYVVMGIVFLTGTLGPPGNGPPPEMGIFFIVFGSAAILVAETFAVCVVIAGRSLAARKRYLFCFVIAVLLCLNGIPVMVLGVFSIVVLARESVKELFARGDAAFPSDPDDD